MLNTRIDNDLTENDFRYFGNLIGVNTTVECGAYREYGVVESDDNLFSSILLVRVFCNFCNTSCSARIYN